MPQFQKNWNKELRRAKLVHVILLQTKFIQFATFKLSISMPCSIQFASDGRFSSSEQTNTLPTKTQYPAGDNEGEPSRNKRVTEPSLVWALATTFGRAIIVASIFHLILDILTFVSPQLLK